MMNSAEAKAFCLSLKCEDITKNLIDTRFSYTYDTKTHKRIPPEIDFQTEFYLEKGEYKDREGKPLNPERVRTNVGQYIVNLCLYGRSARLQRVVGMLRNHSIRMLFLIMKLFSQTRLWRKRLNLKIGLSISILSNG
jgi:hypothetical protein